MSKNINIIIVEDDITTMEMYEDTIREYNIEDELNEGYQINVDSLANDDQVAQLLYDKRIDAIIIDLDWGSGRQKDEGNRLVHNLYKNNRVPIFVVSGNLHKLDTKYEETPIFKLYDRDKVDFMDLLCEIKNLYQTGYTITLGNQSEIDKIISQVFWTYMPGEIITSWKEMDQDLQKRRMLRYAVTRMSGLLSIDLNDKQDDYDAIEFYITPPIKETAFTGDIVSYEENNYVVITAACDMEQEKFDFIVLCQIEFEIFNNLKTKLHSQHTETGDISKTSLKELRRYINNNVARNHLLPPNGEFKGGLIDFQMIKSVEKNEFSENSKIIASINPEFTKDIQARFSHYYGRQGQPQLNENSIIKWIIDN